MTHSPQLLLLLFAAALRQHAGGLERITEASTKLSNELNEARRPRYVALATLLF